MNRTVTWLADGRELIYFDRAEADRSAKDTRTLPPRPAGSELRYDRLLGEWVTIAGHRQDRTHLPASDACPLCPSKPGHLTEIPAADYDVVAFENQFPAYSGPGRCEVMCFSSDHDASFATLSPGQVRLVVEAWADRTAELSELPDVDQVFCFENRGREIGATLSHPHGQIYGYPFVPPRTRRMLELDAFAELLAEERRGPRVIIANEHWTAFVPSAARWPYEVHVAPHRRLPDITALSDAERDAFVPVYLDVLGRFHRLFDTPMPYVSAWHQAPVREGRDRAYLHLELFSSRRAEGKLKFLAGSEAAMGAFINDIAPEESARRLRDC